MDKKVAERLKQARIQAGLTLEKAAEASGRDLSTIWRGEHGITEPERPTLADLAKAYDKTVEWFYTEEATGQEGKLKEEQTKYFLHQKAEIANQLRVIFDRIEAEVPPEEMARLLCQLKSLVDCAKHGHD